MRPANTQLEVGLATPGTADTESGHRVIWSSDHCKSLAWLFSNHPIARFSVNNHSRISHHGVAVAGHIA